MAIFSFVKSLISEKEGVKEYREALARVLSDATITDDEKKELEAIAHKHGLTAEEMAKLQKSAVSGVFTSISADQKITEDEKKSLEALLNHFGIGTKDINFDQKAFNKYYSLALIESGVLPEAQDPNNELNVVFKKGEVLHFGSAAVLRKVKRVTDRINYGGLTASIKITKGLRYRVGSMKVSSVSREVLAAEDSGIFYVTNQRVGYIGARKQFSMPVGKILSFELRPEGIHIFKDGKEAPYILTLDDYEVPSAIVSFLLNSAE